jgi:hypothetical protein
MGTTRPNQQQLDEASRNLNQASGALRTRDEQLALDNQQAQQQQGDAAQKQQQRKMDRIRASVKAQQAKNAAEATAIRQGDHVVVDLDRISRPDQQTAALRQEYVRLHQAGGHQMAGRVVNVENTPNGIYYQIETENMNQRVSAAAVVRADAYAEENDIDAGT